MNTHTSDDCSDSHGQSSGYLSPWPRKSTLTQEIPTTVAAPQFHRHTDFWAQMLGLQRKLLATSAKIEGMVFCIAELQFGFTTPNTEVWYVANAVTSEGRTCMLTNFIKLY